MEPYPEPSVLSEHVLDLHSQRGADAGDSPAKEAGLRVVQLDIPARSGPPPGTVFAAFDRLTKPSANETKTLSMAVGLAALAIETRRLYSDLVHR
jgi:hypothetical protein